MNLKTSHIAVLFLLQLYKTGRHFFYLLYINKLQKLKICEIQSLLLFLTILKALFRHLQTLQETILPRNVSIFREMLKGTEKNFIVPSGVSEYMPLSIISIQRACLIKDKYGNVKLNKRGEILALQRARLIAGASQKLTKLKEVKKMKVQY